jgi:hypothetical protein
MGQIWSSSSADHHHDHDDVDAEKVEGENAKNEVEKLNE